MIVTKLNLLTSGTIDLYEDVPIPLNYSIAEIQKIDKTNSAWSKTITVPGTKNNNKLLGHLFNIGIHDTFDTRVKAPCNITVDSIEIISGHIRLSRIRRSLEEKIEYDLEVQGVTASMFNGMSDDKVATLDFGEFIFLEQNIYDTWVADPTVLNYAFPLVDGGQDSQHKIYPYNLMRPMLNARYVLQKIFQYCNFSWDSDFLDSDFFKHLFIGAITDTWSLTAAELTARRFRASRGTSQALTPTPNTYHDIEFNDDTTSPNTDPSGIYNTATFTANTSVAGYYQVTGQVVMDFSSLTPSQSGYFIEVIALYTFPGLAAQQITMGTADIFTTAQIAIPIYFVNYFPDYGGGATVKFQIRILRVGNPTAGVPNISIKTTSYIDFHHYTGVPNLVGETVQLNKAIDPELTMRDYFTSIIKMFNLYVSPDPENSRKLKIEPRNDFYDAGTRIDWTKKRDIDDPIEIIPYSSDIKEYQFKYARDNDFWNQKYIDTYGVEYADRRVTVNDPSLKNKQVTEISFAPTPCVQFMNSDRVLPAIYHEEKGVAVQKGCKMRILYYAGMKSCNQPFYTNLIDNNFSQPTGTARTSYPFFGMVDDPFNPTVSLDFGVPREIFWETTKYTNNNLYNKYYKQFLEEILNIGSRLVAGNYKLYPADINGLDFRNTIHDDGIDYRLNAVQDYDPVGSSKTRVELIKIVNKNTFSVTSGTILGGGGEEFTPQDPRSTGMTTGELQPIKDRNRAVGQDGNSYFPENGQRVSGQNNTLHPSVNFTSVSGISNFVGADASYVDVLNSSGCIVSGQAKNISLVNSSGVIVSSRLQNVHIVNSGPRTVTESNIAIINNTIFRTSNPNISLYGITVPLSSAQIKTGNSSVIDSGIQPPGVGYAVKIESLAVRYVFNTVPFNTASGFLQVFAENSGEIQAVTEDLFTQSNNVFAAGTVIRSTLDQLVENDRIKLQIGADSTLGDGNAFVYLTYKIIEL